MYQGNDGFGSIFWHLTGKLFCSGWVTHKWFGFGKFPLKIPKISIFLSSGQKKSHRVGSKSTPIRDRSASLLLPSMLIKSTEKMEELIK